MNISTKHFWIKLAIAACIIAVLFIVGSVLSAAVTIGFALGVGA